MCVVKAQNLQMLDLTLHNFQPLGIVGRGRETQLQVGEK